MSAPIPTALYLSVSLCVCWAIIASSALVRGNVDKKYGHADRHDMRPSCSFKIIIQLVRCMGAVRLHDSLEYTSLYNLLAQNKMTTRVKRLQCVENLRTKQHIRQCIV